MKKSENLASTTITDFLGKPLRYIIVTITTIGIVFPLFWLFTSAIKYEADYLAFPPVFFPKEFTFDNFVQVFRNDGVALGLYNSAFISIVATFVAVFIGSMAAYSLTSSQIGTKTRNFFAFWFLIQKMYPAIATAIPIYMVMRSLRLIDTKLSMIILNISFNLPLVIWLMMGFFREIPKEIEESGMIDGCPMARRFFSLILPIAKPGMIAASILAFLGSWNEFLFAVILTIKKAKTLPVIIAGFITDRGLEWGPMAATGVILVLPVLVLVWIMQKDFVAGLSKGAVKG
ncbi:MAG: carbohydrate ABC transporter permease [Sphaerochaeta sp.]|nr:carbohydrate ABC transporter permease [Sphaerochaeta sp.]